MQNYYEILGVPSNATTKEIRWAYRRLAFECHPDRNSQNASSGEILKLANEAYHTLVDPITRDEYDSYLFGTPHPSSLSIDSLNGSGVAIYEGHPASILGAGIRETALLSLTLLGALPVIFLSDLFLPQVTFLSSLTEVWGVTLLAGGFSRATAVRTHYSRIELGIVGIIVGIFGATLLLHPEDNFLPFIAIVKIAAAAGVGGWLGGTLSGRLARFLPLRSPFINMASATLTGAIFGCILGGIGSYVLSSGTLNEYLISSLAPNLIHAEYAALLLGAIGGGTGGAVLGTTIACQNPGTSTGPHKH